MQQVGAASTLGLHRPRFQKLLPLSELEPESLNLYGLDA